MKTYRCTTDTVSLAVETVLGMILMEISRSIGRYNNLESGAVETGLLCAIKTYRCTTDTVPLAVETARSRLAVGDSERFCSGGNAR